MITGSHRSTWERAVKEGRVTRHTRKTGWLAARRKGIGATDVAAILGVHPWKSPLDVYLDKRGLTQFTPSPAQAEMMEWGHRHERAIATVFCERHGCARLNTGEFTRLIHPALPYLSCTPDCIVSSVSHFRNKEDIERPFYTAEAGVPLEIKTTSSHNREQWSDELPPIEVRIQAQVQIACLGDDVEGAYIAVLFNGNDYQDFYMPRDNTFLDGMLHAVEAFWEDSIHGGNPPPPLTRASEYEALKTLYPVTDNEVLHLRDDDPEAGLIGEYKEALVAEKTAKEKKTCLQVALAARLGEKKALVLSDGTAVVWKEEPRPERDVHIPASSPRVMRYTKKWKG